MFTFQSRRWGGSRKTVSSLQRSLLVHDEGPEIDLAVADPQFLSDAVALEVDRPFGRMNDPRYLLGRTAFLDKEQNLDFPGGQSRIIVRDVLQERRHDLLEILLDHGQDVQLRSVQVLYLKLVKEREDNFLQVGQNVFFKLGFVFVPLFQKDAQGGVRFFQAERFLPKLFLCLLELRDINNGSDASFRTRDHPDG